MKSTLECVLDYSNYSQQIGGITGEVVAPVFASRAASLAASAYRTYAAEVGQYGGFGQFPISGGASAGVDFRAIGVGSMTGVKYEGSPYRAVPTGGDPLDISFSVNANGRYTAQGQGVIVFRIERKNGRS